MSVKATGLSIGALNVQILSADYGSSWGSAPTMKNTESFEIALVKNTNGAGAVRLYVYSNGAWNYVALT